ncbi:MAG: PHP domain-containing protein [Candidatus Aenigmarchaeota archaeon]|nr:PHP domain-containing protein [Candidatus Aenigmarchaeota archaeon]
MRLDLHIHTYYSDDAIRSPEEMVAGAKARGLDGLAITEHNNTESWKRAIEAGKRSGLGIILGEEIKVLHEGEKIGEVIALFINHEIRFREFLEVKDEIRSQGGLMIAAHPFDSFRNRFKMLDEFRRYFDAVEAFNARAVMHRFNRKAEEFALKNGMAMTGGSDAHCVRELGKGQTITDIDNVKDLYGAIRKKKTQVWGKESSPIIHAVTTFAKLGIWKSK